MSARTPGPWRVRPAFDGAIEILDTEGEEVAIVRAPATADSVACYRLAPWLAERRRKRAQGGGG